MPLVNFSKQTQPKRQSITTTTSLMLQNYPHRLSALPLLSTKRTLPTTRPLSRLALHIFLVLVIGLMLTYPFATPVLAGSSTLTLEPSTRTVNVGDIFSLTIKLNTGGDSINTVTSVLSFDKNLLKAVSADSSGSAFPIEFESQFDNANGQYRSTRAVPRPGVNGSDILTLKVNFEAIGQGTATISFTDASATYRNNDLQDNLASKNGSTVTINTSGNTTPTPTQIPPTPTTGPGTPTPTRPPNLPSLTPTPTPNAATPTPTPQPASPNPSQTPTTLPSPTPANPDLPDGGVDLPTLGTLLASFSLVLSGSKLLRILE